MSKKLSLIEFLSKLLSSVVNPIYFIIPYRPVIRILATACGLNWLN